MSRRSLSLPISLAIVMIVMLVLLTVGWIVLAVSGILLTESSGALYVTLLVLGTLFLVLIVVGVALYLTLSIKAILLTRRQSNFIDSVTHELKSPIASLKLYLQTLARRPVSAEEQAEFYQFMLDDIERLDQLINHILSAARLDKKTATVDAERINVGELLTVCVHDVCLRYQVTTSTVAFDVQPCVIEGNRVDLALIFRNLIDNAIKYADNDNPQVGVVAQFHAEKGIAVVRISDNGPGIPGPLQRKVFGRFVRLGTELERRTPGTGLGLFIVRTLVDRWKGRIRVSSQDGKTGTAFEVLLPNASAVGPHLGGESEVIHVDAETPEPPAATSDLGDAVAPP